MYDCKHVAKDNNELKDLLNIVKYFSDDIDMDFGLHKSAKITIHKGENYGNTLNRSRYCHIEESKNYRNTLNRSQYCHEEERKNY